MMPLKIKNNRVLYGSVLLLSLLLVFTAAGGGLTGSEGHWLTDWQHKLFRTLCHQDPARSFWINGKPMAVCSRCLGVYTGFAAFWLLIPVMGFLPDKIRLYGKNLLLASVALNFIDVIGNILGFWQNTLFSRLLMGNLIGITAVLLLAFDFITSKSKQERDAYGFIKTG